MMVGMMMTFLLILLAKRVVRRRDILYTIGVIVFVLVFFVQNALVFDSATRKIFYYCGEATGLLIFAYYAHSYARNYVTKYWIVFCWGLVINRLISVFLYLNQIPKEAHEYISKWHLWEICLVIGTFLFLSIRKLISKK